MTYPTTPEQPQTEAERLAQWLVRCAESIEQINAADMLRALAAELAQARAENSELREGLCKGLDEKTMLTDLGVRDGGLFAQVEGGAAGVLAAAFAEQFTQAGGVNYVEVSFSHPKTGPLTVTLQRCAGKTPHQLRAVAEAERDQARAELAQARAELKRLQDKAEFITERRAQKSHRLWAWAHEELSEPLKTRYFNIVANGTADVMEQPTYAQQYNGQKYRAEAAEAERDTLRAELEGLKAQAWAPIESAPKDEQITVAAEFDCRGDWRIKQGHFDSNAGVWRVWGASWTPTHWRPLPAPPTGEV
jgi:hypothetical protein